MDGATATAEVLATRPQTRVLVLTTYDDDVDILRAVEAGASGYLLKDAPQAELVAAIQAALRREGNKSTLDCGGDCCRSVIDSELGEDPK